MFVGVESFSRSALRDAHKLQNHPDRYARIIELCRKHSITTHFSNIIGFPEDTEAEVLDHLRTLKLLDPEMASFYVLTPIPGTEQYQDFLTENVITERNLDRFDTTYPTWRHPHLTHTQLSDLMFRGYREFYDARGIVAKLMRLRRRKVPTLNAVAFWGMCRLAARRRLHPMSGGVARVGLDHVGEYLPLRRRLFGFDLAPLPTNLELSAADQAINHTAKLSA
jgi:radical SAM superfamily enzyme YgiQ (UPF0313 family)